MLEFLFWVSIALTSAILLNVVFSVRSRAHFFLQWLAILVSSFALLFWGISNIFTGEGVNEATWFHLKKGMAGLSAEQVWPLLGLVGFVLFILLVAALFSWRRMRIRRSRGPSTRREAALAIALCATSLAFNPAVAQGGRMLSFMFSRSSGMEMLRDNLEPAVVRSQAATGARKLQSVVYVYAEGLERTFLDKDQFPGLAPSLSNLESEALSVHGMRQAPFTGWTMAGMIASQCGFPADKEKEIEGQHATCTGDLLKERGYRLVYMNGSDPQFAGKGDFYRNHQFDEVIGRKEIQQLEAGRNAAVSEWGVYDDVLFAAAGQKFEELLAKDDPFALVLLTIETHAPHGYESEFCRAHGRYGDGKNAMLNAVHCADIQLGKFVEKVRSSGRDDVVLVLASDHIQFSLSDALSGLNAAQTERQNMWMAFGGSVTPGIVNRASTQFDVAPTLLSIMGVDVPALNLGRDLMRPAPTVMEKLGEESFFTDINKAFVLGDDGYWTAEMKFTKTSPERNSPSAKDGGGN